MRPPARLSRLVVAMTTPDLPTLRALARPFAGHKEWREEWAG